MPLSTFDGEPTIHEHYDADGNLTGTTLIPGWTDEDRAWALGLSLRGNSDTCPGCGGELEETTDYAFRWVPEPPTVCYRCEGLHASMEAVAKTKDPRSRAMLHTVKKQSRPRPKPKRRR